MLTFDFCPSTIDCVRHAEYSKTTSEVMGDNDSVFPFGKVSAYILLVCGTAAVNKTMHDSTAATSLDSLQMKIESQPSQTEDFRRKAKNHAVFDRRQDERARFVL
jgi:hypothetical protein